MAKFRDDQVMMCLASLSYRGFSEGTTGRFHDDAGRRAIAAGLKSLSPLDGRWELVWGPASYRAPLSLLDDELMYVARSCDVADRYVVAIRGTNPISAFDWVFGDLWAAKQVPWPYAGGEAKVSLSAMLGLDILKSLRSNAPPETAPEGLRAILAGALRSAGTRAGGILDRVSGLITPGLGRLRDEVVNVLATFTGFRAEVASDAKAHIDGLQRLWESGGRTRLLDLVEAAASLTNNHLDVAVLSLLEEEAHFRARLGTGIDLLHFLEAAVQAAAGKPVEVVVTGHSKGGGLASTVALWLAETRGRKAPDPEGWDPDGKAVIRCYSYAGPTAGNEAFATRSNEKIGAHCHRIMNPLDVVPHAWADGDLARIATLYDAEKVNRIPALGLLVDTVRATNRGLGYAQVGNDVIELDGVLNAKKPLFFPQLVHQHMQAYLDLLDLTTEGIETATFFDPRAALLR